MFKSLRGHFLPPGDPFRLDLFVEHNEEDLVKYLTFLFRFAPCSCLPKRSFISGEEFVSHPPFVNFSRANPELFEIDSLNRVVWAKCGRNAVGVMLGGLTGCNLVSPQSYIVRSGETTKTKKITISPTESTLCDFRKFLFSVYRRRALKTSLDTDADVSFTTKKQGACRFFLPSWSSCGLTL